MKQPRDYQANMIDEARVVIREVRKRLKAQGITRQPRILLQAPCGSGKTVIQAFITKNALAMAGQTVGFLCHRDFLVDQTSQTYEEMKISHSFIAAGRWYNQWDRVHIGMIGSMKSRLKKVRAPTICFIDEAHHIAASTWSAIIEAWPDTLFIGLSATPCRSDGKGLDTYFDAMVIGPSVSLLIERGALSRYRYFEPTTPDLTGVHIRRGDYAADEVDEVMNKAVIIGDIVRTYKEKALGTKAVYFAPSIKTSQLYVQAFNDSGVRAVHLDGESSKDVRRYAGNQLADGEIDVICNVGLFGEGFDLSALVGRPVTIETVGDCSPTKSLSAWMQRVMRAMRAKDYPAIILDHAGNSKEHGYPDDDFEWSLKGVEKKGGPLRRQCEECGAQIPLTSPICPHCGYVHDEKETRKSAVGAREVEHKDGELHEVDLNAVRKGKKLEEWQAGSLQELIDLGIRRNYKYPQEWAAKMWTLKERKKRAKEHADKQQMQFYEQLMGGRA